MGLISGLVCEHKLPLPLDSFTDDEEKDFKDVKWDELIFYTSSFFDGSTHYGFSNYTISEDGQFYKNEIDIEFVKNKDGTVETKERDGGIERLDFTGEIFFGTEILGDDHDYTITFKALFFKGELKELESDEWNKRSNEKRKKLTDDLYETFRKEDEKKNLWWYKIVCIIKWAIFKAFGFVSSILMFMLRLTAHVRRWISE